MDASDQSGPAAGVRATTAARSEISRSTCTIEPVSRRTTARSSGSVQVLAATDAPDSTRRSPMASATKAPIVAAVSVARPLRIILYKYRPPGSPKQESRGGLPDDPIKILPLRITTVRVYANSFFPLPLCPIALCPIALPDPASAGQQSPVTEERPMLATRKALTPTRDSITHKFTIDRHEGYLTIGLYPDGTPGEMFIKIAKEGSAISGMCQAFCRAFSIALQFGLPVNEAVTRFKGMRFEPNGQTSNPDIPTADSIVDYVARYIEIEFGTPKRR